MKHSAGTRQGLIEYCNKIVWKLGPWGLEVLEDQMVCDGTYIAAASVTSWPGGRKKEIWLED
jgi:hypothetical protein